jgi:hypothetical protein
LPLVAIGASDAMTRMAPSMKKRSLLAVVLLPFLTFGIYGLYWFVSTKNEMNRRGAHVPSAILMILPIVQFFWFWKWAEGAEQSTGGRMSTAGAFLLVLFVPFIGHAIVQDAFNRTPDEAPAVPRAYAM